MGGKWREEATEEHAQREGEEVKGAGREKGTERAGRIATEQ